MQNQRINNRYKKIGLVLSIIAVPVIIYFYFLRWKTSIIYGDDLSIYTFYEGLNTVYEKINLTLLVAEKYRPIQGLSILFLIETFQKSLEGYYIFNVAVQTLITFLFALNANLFLRSPIYSLFVGLTVGLSRFAFFNITQLLNGGAMEGLAMVFFLLSLYFILKILVTADFTASQKQKGLVLSILFANLCLYTHERYVVIIPFIILVILFFPSLKVLVLKQRLFLISLALFSLLLNVFIKKYIYSTPFFIGTAGANISFSPFRSFQFFIEAIFSIFQINTQAEYLTGYKFASLPPLDKALTLLVTGSFLLILALFVLKIRKLSAFKQGENYLLLYISKRQQEYFQNLIILAFLAILFSFLLASAVVTIRMEQRWLQASSSVLILMIVIAASSLRFRKSYIKNALFFLLIILFIWSDYNYLSRGEKNFFFKEAEIRASLIKQAIDNGTVRAGADNLYIWEKQKNSVKEEAVRWSIIDGEFFNFYQNKSKKIFFVDSSDAKINLDKNSNQIIFIGDDGVVDLTDFYLQDSIPEQYKKRE